MWWRRRKLLSDRVRLGRWGEKRAERFLRRRGFRALARNVSCKTGELDLVMIDPEGMLVFVEVKTRADEGFAPAEAAITGAKQRRITQAARYFLRTHDLQDHPCRFDVVSIVVGTSGRPEIRHHEGAFTP